MFDTIETHSFSFPLALCLLKNYKVTDVWHPIVHCSYSAPIVSKKVEINFDNHQFIAVILQSLYQKMEINFDNHLPLPQILGISELFDGP
jgi:hypothetical protein